MKLFTGWSWWSVLLPGCFEDVAHSQAVKSLCPGVFAFSCWKVFIDPDEPEGSSGVFFHFTQFLWPSSLCFSFTLYSRGQWRSWLSLHAVNMFITHILIQVGIDLLIVFRQTSKYARHGNTLKTLLSQKTFLLQESVYMNPWYSLVFYPSWQLMCKAYLLLPASQI